VARAARPRTRVERRAKKINYPICIICPNLSVGQGWGRYGGVVRYWGWCLVGVWWGRAGDCLDAVLTFTVRVQRRSTLISQHSTQVLSSLRLPKKVKYLTLPRTNDISRISIFGRHGCVHRIEGILERTRDNQKIGQNTDRAPDKTICFWLVHSHYHVHARFSQWRRRADSNPVVHAPFDFRLHLRTVSIATDSGCSSTPRPTYSTNGQVWWLTNDTLRYVARRKNLNGTRPTATPSGQWTTYSRQSYYDFTWPRNFDDGVGSFRRDDASYDVFCPS